MKAVELLTTGGTVATTTDRDGQTAPRLGGSELAGLVHVPGVSVTTRELARSPSWALSPVEMAAIAIAARDRARALGVDGVVVSHGTTTLEYTAFLCDLFLDADTPVVLTGAMRRADDSDPDGPRNLRDAIQVAAAPDARGVGAVVVFAGRIIAGGGAWKAQRSASDAFVSLGEDVGSVSATGLRIERRPARRGPFSGALDTRVGLLKVLPGADGHSVQSALRAGVHGLVLEGLPGQGGIPPRMHAAVAEAAGVIPVVLASRAPFGALPDRATGGTGNPLGGMDLLSAGPLSAEQAWLLLMAALGDSRDVEVARRRFRTAATPDTAKDATTVGHAEGSR